jgi:hypothetical protein
MYVETKDTDIIIIMKGDRSTIVLPPSSGSKSKPSKERSLLVCLASSSSLKIEAIHFSETSENFYHQWCHIPENSIFQTATCFPAFCNILSFTFYDRAARYDAVTNNDGLKSGCDSRARIQPRATENMKSKITNTLNVAH